MWSDVWKKLIYGPKYLQPLGQHGSQHHMYLQEERKVTDSPEEQETRNTLKASLVADPIVDPKTKILNCR